MPLAAKAKKEFSEASLKAQQKWHIVPARKKEQERTEREEEKVEERKGRKRKRETDTSEFKVIA